MGEDIQDEYGYIGDKAWWMDLSDKRFWQNRQEHSFPHSPATEMVSETMSRYDALMEFKI